MGVLRGLFRAVGGLLAGVFGLLKGLLTGVGSLALNVYVDDGAVAWINGVEPSPREIMEARLSMGKKSNQRQMLPSRL